MHKNNLIIETSQFGFDFNIEILPWNKGLTTYRVYHDGEMEELEGNLGVGFDSFGISSSNEWMRQIPLEALQNTYDFSEYQFYMLWLAANSDTALALLIKQPLLIALVCSATQIERTEALEMCNQGSKCILASLGLDNSDLALSFIDKLRFTYEYGHELTYVRKYLGSDKMHHRFMHYNTVNDMAFAIDQSTPQLTGSTLSLKLSEVTCKHVWSKAGLIRNTLLLSEKVEDFNAIALRNCQSLSDVRALQTQLRELDTPLQMEQSRKLNVS
ncbi:hypothetical protein ACWU4D_00130 [Vibrio sp. WJH972]